MNEFTVLELHVHITDWAAARGILPEQLFVLLELVKQHALKHLEEAINDQ